MASDDERKPTPDPTILTTEQLLREIANATKLLEAKIEGAASFCIERFSSIETQLALIERQRVEQKADTKAAVDAALAAAKEAVKEQTAASEKAITKSEEITKTQLLQLGDNFTASLKGLADSLADVKDRVVKIEARRLGADETTVTKRLDAGYVVAAVSMAAALIVAVVVITNVLTGGAP